MRKFLLYLYNMLFAKPDQNAYISDVIDNNITPGSVFPFFMGDRVINQRSQPPICGTVVGFAIAKYYNSSNVGWDDLAPGWQDKYAVFVAFDTPIKMNDNYYHCLVYPQDDLILLDEVCNENSLPKGGTS